MDYVRENEFNGRVWLQILEIARMGEMPEEFIQKVEKKLNDVYNMDQLDLKTVVETKELLSFT